MEFTGYDKDFRLQGKTAFITGAGGGIGHAIATLFYEKGANLVLVDLNPGIAEVGRQLAPDPRRVATVVADITEPAQRERAVG